MDKPQVDFEELRQFVADLKADRAAQKEKERKESWTKYVSVSLVLIAVLSAIATSKGGGLSTKSLRAMNDAAFRQSQASDQWSFYQAKSTKRHLYEIDRDHLKKAGQDTKTDDERIDRYEKESAEIKAKAEELEKLRDVARATADKAAESGKEVGGLVSLLQVAVACGSISLVIKKKPLWFLALAIAAYASVRLAIAFQIFG